VLAFLARADKPAYSVPARRHPSDPFSLAARELLAPHAYVSRNCRNFRSSLCITIKVRRSQVNAFTTILAIGCLLFVAGAPVSCALVRHCGTVVVQGSLSDEVLSNISAPENAVATSTTVVVPAFIIATLVFVPDFISRSSCAAFATAIRPLRQPKYLA
jgi:hypothetical protein